MIGRVWELFAPARRSFESEQIISAVGQWTLVRTMNYAHMARVSKARREAGS